MAPRAQTGEEEKRIEALVKCFQAQDNQERVARFLDQLWVSIEGSSALSGLIHSKRRRLKDAEHLRGKLRRKAAEAKGRGRQFAITEGNLFSRVNDLGGIRLLHLHRRQIEGIDKALKALLTEEQYDLVEGPVAKTWDDEFREYYRSLGFRTERNSELYTSVHYVVESASLKKTTCEIQVRTLMEEVWGEVSHQVNYPSPSQDVACKEQLKALARITSGTGRLVDSIYATVDDRAAGALRGAEQRRPRPGARARPA